MWRTWTRLLALLLAWVLQACGTRSAGFASDPPAPAAITASDEGVAKEEYAAAVKLLLAGDEAAGVAALEKIIQMPPDHAGPLLNLALVRVEHADNDAAEVLLRRAALVCHQDCAQVYTELGIVERIKGDFAAAEKAYREAINADPAYADAYFNLGVLCDLYDHQPKLALFNYQRYVELQSDPGGIQDVNKWIADLSQRTRPVERSAQRELSHE